MKEISKQSFCREHERLVGRRKIDDRHYYYGHDKTHEDLAESIKGDHTWTVIIYGDHHAPRKTYGELPGLFRRLPATWEQRFFIGDSQSVTIYRGNSLGSGYRFTHGIMANAFAFLKRDIKTFILSQGIRGGLRIHASETLRVHGHELHGNYPVSPEVVDKTVPKNIRVYGPIPESCR
jgi:hypothetical protein